MTTGGETADQMTRMTLQGIEVAANIALKAGGSTAKSLAATLYAILTDRKKIRGKTRLNSMLKSGKELKVFAIRHKDLKTFCEEAKRYGVLYSVLKEKNNSDGICDIMVRAEDAAKISRIVDKYELATIDTNAIRESILNERQNPLKDTPILNDKEHDDLQKRIRADYISDLPYRKEQIFQFLKSMNLDNYPSAQLEDFSFYVFKEPYQTVKEKMEKEMRYESGNQSQ